jgi:isocitrate/isopropylmalate dehydrogenase
MMLNHISDERDDPECRKVAVRIKDAYNRALEEGQRTRDLGGSLGTREFTNAIISRFS